MAAVLRSGWLTSGPNTKKFEEEFAAAVGARHAVALNSCTAALHLATVALDLKPGQGVLIPTMTFAATAEVVRYAGAMPILCDCDPVTGHLDLTDAADKITALRLGHLPPAFDPQLELVGLIPVHTAGLMMNIEELEAFVHHYQLWMVEDAAHSFPAAWRPSATEAWERCGEDTSRVTCFSFYANKTITTGEGGMATTDDEKLAAMLRSMSLHGLSNDAWGRYWGPGRLGLPHSRAGLQIQPDRQRRRPRPRPAGPRRSRCGWPGERIARTYLEAFAELEEIALPPDPPDRIHSWHLFQIRLAIEKLSIDRDEFLRRLRQRGIGFSVHWRPLHLHPYYQETFGWRPEYLPRATDTFRRTVSLPIFPSQRDDEVAAVIAAVKAICRDNRRG